MQHIAGCLGREIAAGRSTVPGGILHRTSRWIVNHAVGRLNLGTLIVAPHEHVDRLPDVAQVPDPRSARDRPTMLVP
jgi:ATP adenylyltransferase